MAAPLLPALFALTLTSDYAGVVTLSHPVVPATPTLLGYKYFVDTSLSGVQAKAAADIAADTAARASFPPPQGSVPTGFGGITPNAEVLVDLASGLVAFGGPTYSQAPINVGVSRKNLAGTVTFPYAAGAPGAPVTLYFAVVAWNEDGASAVTTASLVYQAASAPTVQSIVADETAVEVTFTQPVHSALGTPGAGFSFTVNGVAASVASAAIMVNPAVVRFVMTETIDDRDTVLVSYDAAQGDLSNTPGSFPVASFSNHAVTTTSDAARLHAVVAALVPSAANVLTALFSLPVVSSDYLVGLSFSANGVPVVPTSVVPGPDPRDLIITFPNMFDVADLITMSYDATLGDWMSNSFAIPSITSFPVTNASHVGSEYPLSSVIQEPLCVRAGEVIATVGIDLNYVDRELNRRYGPVQVDFGGTFGITPENPAGIFVPQDLVTIDTGLTVRKSFRYPGVPSYATAAGRDWLNVVTERIGVALGVMRTQDASVVLGELHVSQV